jgi:hypothetical protein
MTWLDKISPLKLYLYKIKIIIIIFKYFFISCNLSRTSNQTPTLSNLALDVHATKQRHSACLEPGQREPDKKTRKGTKRTRKCRVNDRPAP